MSQPPHRSWGIPLLIAAGVGALAAYIVHWLRS